MGSNKEIEVSFFTASGAIIRTGCCRERMGAKEEGMSLEERVERGSRKGLKRENGRVVKRKERGGKEWKKEKEKEKERRKGEKRKRNGDDVEEYTNWGQMTPILVVVRCPLSPVHLYIHNQRTKKMPQTYVCAGMDYVPCA